MRILCASLARPNAPRRVLSSPRLLIGQASGKVSTNQLRPWRFVPVIWRRTEDGRERRREKNAKKWWRVFFVVYEKRCACKPFWKDDSGAVFPASCVWRASEVGAEEPQRLQQGYHHQLKIYNIYSFTSAFEI